MRFDGVIAAMPFILGGLGGYLAHRRWPGKTGRIIAATGAGAIAGVMSPWVATLPLLFACVIVPVFTGRRCSF